MPTIAETEDRLRDTLNAVASSVDHSEAAAGDLTGAATPASTSSQSGGETRRRRPLMVFFASFIAVLLLGTVNLLIGGNEPGRDSVSPIEPNASTSPVPVTTGPLSTDEASPDTNAPPGARSATAEYWAQALAGLVDTVSRMDTFGPEPEPDARVTDYLETGDPFRGDGSMSATVESADGELTVAAEYRRRGAAVDDIALDAEIAEFTADGTEVHIDTIWHGADMGSMDEGKRAEFFLREGGSGSARITVLTAIGQLVVEVEASDQELLFDRNQLMGIANGMIGTSLDLTWDPDHPLSTAVESLPEPDSDDWVALDSDLWVASVPEGESARLWVKTDTQEPTSAISTDTRSLYAYARSAFVVIVVGEPVPDAITVSWDDGSTESAEPTWNDDLDMSFARFDDKPAQLVSVDGP